MTDEPQMEKGSTVYDPERNRCGTVVGVTADGVVLEPLEGGAEWTASETRPALTSEVLADRIRKESRRWW
jgi:hypothetical protein